MDFSLETIRKNVIECTKCELCKTRKNAVPGKGSFNSDVMFIGEAPGRNEDLQGEPFVGIDGKKLSLALGYRIGEQMTNFIGHYLETKGSNVRIKKIDY